MWLFITTFLTAHYGVELYGIVEFPRYNTNINDLLLLKLIESAKEGVIIPLRY
jgi:hypothetical protein